MTDCCGDRECAIEALKARQTGTLRIVLAINAVMFVVVLVAGLFALAANGTCLWLLWKHRAEDVNMSSVWECSRNDIASNVSVFLAAGLLWLTQSGWPDLVVGFALACLFLRSAVNVSANAFRELRASGMKAA